MEDVLTWVTEHWPLVLGVVYALLNVVNGVLRLIPGNQGEQEGGWLGTVRGVVDRVSVLTGQDGKGTLKLPGTASTPTVDEE